MKAIATLNADLDTLYPASGSVGYVALLDNDLTLNLEFSVTSLSNNEITTTAAHHLVTGSRVRVASTALVPSPLAKLTDYYAIRVSATVLKLATTLANALAGAAIDLTDNGTGTLTLNEQELSVEDSLAALVNHELSHPSYTRYHLNNIGAAANGRKTVEWTMPIDAADPQISWRYWLIIKGGVSTIGDTTGTKDHLFTEAATLSAEPGQTPTLSITLKLA